MSRLMLDLFCGGGGATKGYMDAGWKVVGVDHNYQSNYPGYQFIKADAINVLDKLTQRRRMQEGYLLDDFDFIHASPPCQAYTRKQTHWGRERKHFAEHHDLLDTTRKLLEITCKPYVIENVPGSPIRGSLLLCGTMFGLRIIKHRYFEANFDLGMSPATCNHADVYNPWQGEGRSAEKLREAMGIDWLPISGGASRKAGYTGDLFNAIPPAYTRHIGQVAMEVAHGMATQAQG